MTKLNEKRDELCVETENADEQKGFVMGWDAALTEVMPMMREMAETIRYVMAENDKVKGWDKLHDTFYRYNNLVGERTISKEDVKLNDDLKALHDKYVGEK